METTPAIDKVVDFFDAHTVELYSDVRDRVATTIIDICSGEGSTVRFCNAAEEEFMKARTDRVSKLYQPLFDEKLMGVRHAENGRLYAIIENMDNDADEWNKTREVPVGALPFADVQVGPDCEFGRRITAVAIEYGPVAVTVSLMAPFTELVSAARPYTDGEADELL
jgi:hypothetical protein